MVNCVFPGFCFYMFRISKAGGAEREAIEDVLGVMRVQKIRKSTSNPRLALCDGSVGDLLAPGMVMAVRHASSSSCMEIDQLESNLAEIRGLVHTMW